MTRKLCLVLGAGFSAPFKLPLTRELWDLCLQRPTVHDAPLLDDVARHYPLEYFVAGNIQDVELLLSVWQSYEESLDEAKEFLPDLFEAWRDNRFRLNTYLNCLQDWLRQKGTAALTLPLTDELAAFFRRVRSNGEVSIVSLNYDLIVEQTIRRANMDYWYVDERRWTDSKDAIRIVKPHGSINWVQTSDEGQEQGTGYRPDKIWPSRDAIERTKLVVNPSDAEALETAVWAWNGNLSLSTTHITNPLDPLAIIPPTSGKRYRLFHRILLVEAAREIASSTAVVVVGMSLPPADLVVKQLIQSAVVQNGRRKLWFVNDNPHAADKATRVFHGCELELVREKWSVPLLYELSNRAFEGN